MFIEGCASTIYRTEVKSEIATYIFNYVEM